MKQAKIKNFIKLISKIHSKSKEEPRLVFEVGDNQISQHQPQQRQHYNTISVDEQNLEKHAASHCRNTMSKCNQSAHINLFFTENSIKHRYDQKKSFYEVYRETLQKKKEQHSSTNKKMTDRLMRAEEELTHSKQLNFPISRSNRHSQRRESYTYQKILRKKSILLSNRSISIVPHESERKLRMDRIKQAHESQKNNDPMPPFQEEQSMRDKRLNYKPIFRIKRINIQSNKTQTETKTNTSADNSKIEKHPFGKRCGNAKTQPAQNDPRNISFRQRIHLKKKEKLKVNLNDNKFTAWDHEKQESQLTSRLLF